MGNIVSIGDASNLTILSGRAGAQPARERQRYLTMNLLTANQRYVLALGLTGHCFQNHEASFCAGQTRGRAGPF